VFYFLANGEEKLSLSSADWMERNFFRRIELAFPLLDAQLKKRVLREGLRVYLTDNQQAWEMSADGDYSRKTSRGKPRNAQTELLTTQGGNAPRAASGRPLSSGRDGLRPRRAPG
jgi:polyphosphate kinase